MKPHFGLLASPPPLPRIVARAQVACSLAMRADLEAHEDVVAAAGIIALCSDWLDASGHGAELAAEESDALGTTPGGLSPPQRERYATQAEAAALLAWALQRAPLPGFAVDADGAATAAALGWLDAAGAQLGTTARLRAREQLMALLDAIGAVHWRLLDHTRRPDASVSMQRFAPDQHAWPDEVTPCELVDGDLALAGAALRAVDGATLFAALRRVQERHRALLWLLGQQRDYWSVALPQ